MMHLIMPGATAAIARSTRQMASIDTLPDEIILHILSYLDVPELLNAARTNHHLRELSCDPVLHSARLSRVSATLARSIHSRPPLADLIYQRIYITRTTSAARDLGRKLTTIRLNRALTRRPAPSTLVQLGVLPQECLCNGRGEFLAPSLIETKRRIEREKLKDTMRRWVDEWHRRGDRRRGHSEEREPDVSAMVRRFTRISIDGAPPRTQWGVPAARAQRREEPTRAKVLGLRRYWERLSSTSAA